MNSETPKDRQKKLQRERQQNFHKRRRQNVDENVAPQPKSTNNNKKIDDTLHIPKARVYL